MTMAASPAAPSSGRERSAASRHAAVPSCRGRETPPEDTARAPVRDATAIAVSKLKGNAHPPGRRKNARATASETARGPPVPGIHRTASRLSASSPAAAIARARTVRAAKEGPVKSSTAAPAHGASGPW